MEKLVLTPNCKISFKDGTLVEGAPSYMAMEEQVLAYPGDKIVLLDKNYCYAVAIYWPKRLPNLFYKYGYAKEANWTVYTRNMNADSLINHDYQIMKKRYFRIVVVRRDGKAMTDEDISKADSIVAFVPCEEVRPTPIVKPWFRDEIENCSERVNAIRRETPNNITFALLTDSHFTVNGTWEDTARNISEMAKVVDYDAVIHLGDLTDGMLSKNLTEKYVKKTLADLRNSGKPVYITIGNHDRNYFKNSHRALSTDEMREVYEVPASKKLKYLDYFVDIKEKGVRLIFMESFNNDRFFRYGYSNDQIQWLKSAIKTAHKGTKFFIFSHDTPLQQHDAINIHTLNGKRFIKVLEHYNGLNGFKIMGLIYGHTHADFVYDKLSFPLVSINTCKLEFFKEMKPKGAIRWFREENSATQDCWDSLVCNLDTGKLSFIRFGAGEDRFV